MATRIKPVPVLEGEDTRKFHAQLDANSGKRMPSEAFERLRKIVEVVEKNAK